MEWYDLALRLLSPLVAIAALVFTINSARSRASKEESDKLDSRLSTLERTAIKREDVDGLKASIGELSGIVRDMKAVAKEAEEAGERSQRNEGRVMALERDAHRWAEIEGQVDRISEDRLKVAQIHQATFEQLRDRIGRVEETIKHSPSANQVSDLRTLVEKMGGDIRVLSEGMRPLAASVGRIDDFLMGQAGKRGQA
ncbi:hypothetical protein [Aurantimonas sp. 22II-16-19i]|uniref:hypothetical protein n=1 Tax=Aurantimonas sp. 22II-16-19i TaxID=1317114 RepID=UPI0009F7F2C4|nr:hypothetical protein [Aurantimonas sp. 22II-16-19i]ORE98696.1 hypothetical protein ATO4_04250 [Aurantimonas sp. 22II-16-19i]